MAEHCPEVAALIREVADWLDAHAEPRADPYCYLKREDAADYARQLRDALAALDRVAGGNRAEEDGDG